MLPSLPQGNCAQPTTDPNAALNGTLAAFGGHKGAALALVVELTGSALSNGVIAGDAQRPKSENWGHTVLAFKPEQLVDDFAERAAAILMVIGVSMVRIGT